MYREATSQSVFQRTRTFDYVSERIKCQQCDTTRLEFTTTDSCSHAIAGRQTHRHCEAFQSRSNLMSYEWYTLISSFAWDCFASPICKLAMARKDTTLRYPFWPTFAYDPDSCFPTSLKLRGTSRQEWPTTGDCSADAPAFAKASAGRQFLNYLRQLADNDVVNW